MGDAGPRHRQVVRTTTLALITALLLAPLLVLLGSSSASAATLCLPQPKQTGCISGTIGGRSNPIEGVTVILTAPDKTQQKLTTAADGKFSFEVKAAGTYLVGVDEDTIPKGMKFVSPPAAVAGPNGELKVNATLGQTAAATIQVRADDFSTKTSKIDDLLQNAAAGLRLGLLLALASVGLSLIYGTTGLSNFAHAEQVTLGGMLGYGFVNLMGLPLIVGGVIVVVLCALSGYVQDRVLWQPLRRRGLGLTQLMIVTIGLSLAMQYAFQFFVGAGTVKVTIKASAVHKIGPVTLTNSSYIGMAISIVVLVAVGIGLQKTRIGRATRAVSDNPALAAASGIDSDKLIRLVWTVAAGLAGLSGLLYALAVNGVKWDTGLQILLLLFASVTLGGLGTAFGALVGSLVIGMVVSVAPVLGMPSDFRYATALVILILLLLVRPQGLLGKPQRVG